MQRSCVRASIGLILVLAAILGGTAQSAKAAADAVTITYWDFISPKGDDPRGKALAENIARFEAKNPGIKVQVQVVPWQLIDTQLVQAAAAKDTPDVIRITNYFFQLHAKAGTLEPLNTYVKNWDNDAFVVPWNDTVFDGNKIGIPYDVRTIVLEYRDDLIKQAGLKVPRTWEEVCHVAGALTKGNVVGFEMGLSKADLASNLMETFLPLVWAAGGEILDAKGKAAFNSKAGVQAVQAIYDIMHKCKGMTLASLGYGYNDVQNGLRAGTIAMGTLGTHRVATIRAQGNFGDRFLSMPLPGFSPDKPAPGYMIYFVLSMGRYSKHKEEAWKFIEFMTNREAELVRVKGGEVPSRKMTYEDPGFKSIKGIDAKEMFVWRDYMVKYGHSFRHPEQWQQFMRLLADTIQPILLRQTPIEAALNQLAEKYDALVEGGK